VTAADAQAAIGRIAARRARIDDPNAWRLSDDPAEVLVYLQRYSTDVPRWVAEADVLDGLTLRLRLWWLGEEAELWLLERAQRLGLAPRFVGPRLGIATRQGVHDRRRLAREKVARLRGEPPRELPVDGHIPDAEQEWLDAHRAEILHIAREAVGRRGLADDEAAEWLADVARDVRDGLVTPGSVQTLRFALVELAGSAAVRDADDGDPVHDLLARWARLYASCPRP
jgi:hypothetical protein